MTPTARSIAYLREQMVPVDTAERWIPGANVRRDLFGCIDLVALYTETTAFIQVTTADNMAAREAKIRASQHFTELNKAGREVWLHGWSKRGKRGERKRWTLTERRVQ